MIVSPRDTCVRQQSKERARVDCVWCLLHTLHRRRLRAQKGAAQRRAGPDSRGSSGEHGGTTNKRAGRHRHHGRTDRARLLPTAPARSCGVRAHRADSQGVVRQHRRRRGGDSSPARRRGSCLHERACTSWLVRARAERAPRSHSELGLTTEISAGTPHSRRQCGIDASGSSPEPTCTDRRSTGRLTRRGDRAGPQLHPLARYPVTRVHVLQSLRPGARRPGDPVHR